jgi:hypothetical protein
MMQLDLSLSPRQSSCAFERGNIMVFIGQADNFVARTGDKRPKRDPNGRAGRDANAPANAEDRIEYRSDRV